MLRCVERSRLSTVSCPGLLPMSSQKEAPEVNKKLVCSLEVGCLVLGQSKHWKQVIFSGRRQKWSGVHLEAQPRKGGSRPTQRKVERFWGQAKAASTQEREVSIDPRVPIRCGGEEQQFTRHLTMASGKQFHSFPNLSKQGSLRRHSDLNTIQTKLSLHTVSFVSMSSYRA